MDLIPLLAIACVVLSLWTLIVARRAERNSLLKPKIEIEMRRYDLAPGDFLTLIPQRELTLDEAINLSGAIAAAVDIQRNKVLILPPNSQIAVIRKLADGQMASVTQSVESVVPQTHSLEANPFLTVCPSCGSSSHPKLVKRGVAVRVCTDEWHMTATPPRS